MSNLDVIRERRDIFRKWLDDKCPSVFIDQRHLNSGSNERDYWHYGYYIALRDVLGYVDKRDPAILDSVSVPDPNCAHCGADTSRSAYSIIVQENHRDHDMKGGLCVSRFFCNNICLSASLGSSSKARP